MTVALGGLLFAVLGGQFRKSMGCAFLQLVYVIPALLFFFRRHRTWALGFLFGAAVVFLLASMCGSMGNMH